MKIKYINESISRKVNNKSYIYEEINNEYINGYIGLVDIGKINIEKLYVPRENRESDCVLASHYKYLRLFFKDKNYAFIAAYNEKLEFIEFYIDVIDCVKIDKKTNLPYITDLYLDFVYTNKDEIITLDEDELENAYLNKEISESEYNIALQTKIEILALLNNKQYMDKLKKYCNVELNRLYNKLNKKEGK